MSLETLWNAYRTGGYAALRRAELAGALDHLYGALVAFAEDAFDTAAELAHTAARLDPASRAYAQAATYLDRVVAQGKAGVYVDGEAFAAFIRGGGNIGLYDAASAALHAVYQRYDTLTLLDVGVGDGLALLPALTSNITQLDVLEPSEAMLHRTAAELRRLHVPHRAHEATIQRFMTFDLGPWDVIQATWSLQSVPPDERPAVFAWMRAHGQRVLIAEFDVPAFEAVYSPDRVRYIVSHYEKGLAEYDGDGGLVAQGFLMPVMFGYFDRSAARTNWEGPIQEWADGLRAAGFADVTARPLYDYFWATAYLVEGA